MGTYKWKPFTLLVSAEEVEKEVLRIEAGKYYKTRDGRKVGPAVFRNYLHNIWPWYVGDEALRRNDGKVGGDGTFSDSFDLISEWQDETTSPIRTVKRRGIVPGVYGRIKITGTYQGNRVTMDWDRNDIITAAVPIVGMSAEELREAAHLFNQLAEALEEAGK